ncbi:long-chain fatty acid transport protein 2-like [Glandiceps talaboti]
MDERVGYTLIAIFAVVGVFIRLHYPWLFYDVRYLFTLLKIRKFVRSCVKNDKYLVDIFLESVERHPDKACIVYNNKVHSYKQMNTWSDQFANFMYGEELKCGDTVAIFMYNEPFYLCAWLGCAKLGVKCALLNYNLRKTSLVHCLAATNVSHIIVGQGDGLVTAIEEISDHLKENDIKVWVHGDHKAGTGKFRDITSDVQTCSDEPIPKERRRGVRPNHVSVYIYTSGTTGLPKAGKITHTRHLGGSNIFSVFKLKRDDIFYICLPFYHSSGIMLSLANGMRLGTTMVIAPKFSASRFWQDVRKHNVTVVFYVGEICRYLLAQPESDKDKENNVWMAIGNGLRPDIWTKFAHRFAIPFLGEFYGATEGNIFFYNPDNKIGACGCISPFLKRLMKCELVEYEYDKAEPTRGPDGRCIPVEHGKAGLLLVAITERAPFQGYEGNKEMTERKVVRNAFTDGDLYFNTGDILAMDKEYYVYFLDRLGDTFRWKGENVSTNEVAQVIMAFSGVNEVNVYGVSVPGHEGRAGMAAAILADENNFDFREFYTHLTEYLPLYACPRFIRTRDSLPITGTYKYTKMEMVKEGFDPTSVNDPVYYMDTRRKTYMPLNSMVYNRIVDGEERI